jgi:hypothetical protein
MPKPLPQLQDGDELILFDVMVRVVGTTMTLTYVGEEKPSSTLWLGSGT